MAGMARAFVAGWALDEAPVWVFCCCAKRERELSTGKAVVAGLAAAHLTLFAEGAVASGATVQCRSVERREENSSSVAGLSMENGPLR